jgi:LCP family protein required for cell wall assembly
MSADEANTQVEPEEARPLEEEAEQPAAPRRHKALRRVLIAAGVLVVVLALIIGGGIWFLTDRYAGNIHRIDNAFSGLNDAKRPAPSTPGAGESQPPVTFLLLGSDTRAHPAPGEQPGSRSDATMLVRLSGDRKHAQVISIPRDSWVPIPGHGVSKINAAYSWGGVPLAVQTIEQLTGVRIDHVAAIDFDGIINVTDQLGGVDVYVSQTTKNGPYTFQAGLNHLNGDQARWYLGQRHGLPGGDFDREKRDQQYLKSMFGKLFSSNTFTDPVKLDKVLRTVTGSVAVDNTLSNTDLLSLAYSMRDLRPADIQYLTAPVLGTGMEGAASVVYLDKTNCDRMWAYLKSDSLGQNAAEFKQQQLPAVPN